MNETLTVWEFILRLAPSIAWPLAIMLLALIFARPLRQLLPAFQEGEFPGGVKVKFSIDGPRTGDDSIPTKFRQATTSTNASGKVEVDTTMEFVMIEIQREALEEARSRLAVSYDASAKNPAVAIIEGYSQVELAVHETSTLYRLSKSPDLDSYRPTKTTRSEAEFLLAQGAMTEVVSRNVKAMADFQAKVRRGERTDPVSVAIYLDVARSCLASMLGSNLALRNQESVRGMIERATAIEGRAIQTPTESDGPND